MFFFIITVKRQSAASMPALFYEEFTETGNRSERGHPFFSVEGFITSVNTTWRFRWYPCCSAVWSYFHTISIANLWKDCQIVCKWENITFFDWYKDCACIQVWKECISACHSLDWHWGKTRSKFFLLMCLFWPQSAWKNTFFWFEYKCTLVPVAVRRLTEWGVWRQRSQRAKHGHHHLSDFFFSTKMKSAQRSEYFTQDSVLDWKSNKTKHSMNVSVWLLCFLSGTYYMEERSQNTQGSPLIFSEYTQTAHVGMNHSCKNTAIRLSGVCVCVCVPLSLPQADLFSITYINCLASCRAAHPHDNWKRF